jgi:aryl-alcohol dehydrogenase-like predicted oxidoreductase
MHYRPLGRTGIKVSPYALGAMIQRPDLRRRPVDERAAA